jgi:hypothetical protein
VKYQYAFSLL